MWRYAAGAAAGVLLVVAGMMLQAMRPTVGSPLAAMPAVAPPAEVQDAPPAVPEATAATREQKRFNRYDKDRDGTITRDEYLAARRKAFAKLDKDGSAGPDATGDVVGIASGVAVGSKVTIKIEKPI